MVKYRIKVHCISAYLQDISCYSGAEGELTEPGPEEQSIVVQIMNNW